MWPQWWVMNVAPQCQKARDFKQQQSCAPILLQFRYLQWQPCALSCTDRTFCSHRHSPTLMEMGQQYQPGLSAPRGCEQRLHTGHASLCSLMACSSLPCRGRGLQRSSAEKGTILCWGRESYGNGKSRLSSCALKHQWRVKGLLEQQFFLLPQWHQIGREAVWNPIDRLFRKFKSVKNVAIPFLLFELKSWKNEMLFCSERSRSSVILSDGFFCWVGGGFLSGNTTIFLVCVYWV